MAIAGFAKILESRGLRRTPCASKKLKAGLKKTDAKRMFMPCPDKPTVCESTIVAFCFALNTPVINIEALEVGPARSGIMLEAGEYGELQLWVRVSLISSGDGITFKFQGDPREFGDASAAMDAALSFSEGMGFLFDEDLLRRGGRSGRQRASKIWKSLCSPREQIGSKLEVPKAGSLAPLLAVAGPAVELELINVQPLGEADASQDCAAEPMPGSGSSPSVESQTQLFVSPDDGYSESEGIGAVGSPVLSKFRKGAVAGRGGNVTESSSAPNSEELARIELASEQVASEVLDHSGFLTRLLSSFFVSN